MNTVSEEYSEIENIKNININQKIPSQDKKMLLKKIIFDNKENSTLEETNEIPQLPKIMISNVVSTVYLFTNLDLRYIASKLINCECNYTKSGIIKYVKMSLKNPKATAMIYKTGKINIFGAKNELSALKAFHLIIKSLKKIGYPFTTKTYRITNIVGTCYLNFGIDLKKLSSKLLEIDTKNKISQITKDRYSYDCDVFPALIYYMNEPRITIKIFSKGIINFVGAQKKMDINKVLGEIYPILLNYKMNDIDKNKEKDQTVINFNNIK